MPLTPYLVGVEICGRWHRLRVRAGHIQYRLDGGMDFLAAADSPTPDRVLCSMPAGARLEDDPTGSGETGDNNPNQTTKP